MLNSNVNVVNMLSRDMEANSNPSRIGMLNKPLVIGDIHLSIQCSSEHMSSPRSNTFLSDYQTMEIGIDFKQLTPGMKLYIEIMLGEYFVSNYDTFYTIGNVPVEEINRLIGVLQKEQKLI